MASFFLTCFSDAYTWKMKPDFAPVFFPFQSKGVFFVSATFDTRGQELQSLRDTWYFAHTHTQHSFFFIVIHAVLFFYSSFLVWYLHQNRHQKVSLQQGKPQQPKKDILLPDLSQCYWEQLAIYLKLTLAVWLQHVWIILPIVLKLGAWFQSLHKSTFNSLAHHTLLVVCKLFELLL